MRYTYDDEADALYVRLVEDVEPVRSVVVDDDRAVDMDDSDRVVGIEILGASEAVRLQDLIERFSLDAFGEHLRKLEQAKFQRVVSASQ
jgi:uncharacterized protein YuzE